MDLRLTDKTVLITGASRGIGLATAHAFAAEGCRLMLSARSAAPLAETEAMFLAQGVTVAACAGDVTKAEDAAALIEATVEAFGGIDILINNAGGGGVAPPSRPARTRTGAMSWTSIWCRRCG